MHHLLLRLLLRLLCDVIFSILPLSTLLLLLSRCDCYCFGSPEGLDESSIKDVNGIHLIEDCSVLI